MSRRQEIFKLVEGLIKDHKGSEYEVSMDLDLRKDLEVDSVDLIYRRRETASRNLR